MHSVVCVKQVPAGGRAVINASTGTLDRGSADRRINPDDIHAIEFALELRERYGGSITALTMGPPAAAEVLVECFAYGCDRGVLLSDPRLIGSDALVTGRCLSAALERIGPWDFVVAGVESSDGGTGSVSYMIAECCKAPHMTQIHDISLEGDTAVIERLYGHEYQKIRARLPIVCAIGRGWGKPRFASLSGIQSAPSRCIDVLSIDDISIDERKCGLRGSPTLVVSYETFSHKREKRVLEGTLDEKADALVQLMKARGILRY